MPKTTVLPDYREVFTRRAEPLVVDYTPAGASTRSRVDLRDWPGAVALRTELADSIEALTGSLGTWESITTVNGNCSLVRRFSQFCAGHGVECLAGLGVREWNGFMQSVGASGVTTNTYRKMISAVRLVVGRYPQRLTPQVRARLMRRMPTPQPNPHKAYPVADFRAVEMAARSTVRAAAGRIGPNWQLLGRLGDPSLTDVERSTVVVLDQLMDTGMITGGPEARSLGLTPECQRDARRLLFLTGDEAVAAAVLMACTEGLNYSVIDERAVPSAAPGLGVPEALTSVEDLKRRRHRHPHDAHAIPPGARQGMAHIKIATEPAREYLRRHHGGSGAGRLLNYWPKRTLLGVPSTGIPHHQRLLWWPEHVDRLSYSRLRKTFTVHVDRTMQGHSRATWITSYLLADESERERLRTESVEAGLWSLISNADSHLRFTRSDTDPDSDTPVGGCVDYQHHPDTGTPCGDDFLLCLGCANAVATPRHLPRLLALKTALEACASTDGPAWTESRALAHARLMSLLNDRALIGGDELAAAAAAVTDQDRLVINLLLTGGLS